MKQYVIKQDESNEYWTGGGWSSYEGDAARWRKLNAASKALVAAARMNINWQIDMTLATFVSPHKAKR